MILSPPSARPLRGRLRSILATGLVINVAVIGVLFTTSHRNYFNDEKWEIGSRAEAGALAKAEEGASPKAEAKVGGDSEPKSASILPARKNKTTPHSKAGAKVGEDAQPKSASILPARKNKTTPHSSHHFLYHGKVLNEFSGRILRRSIVPSNVLVVSPDVGQQYFLEHGEHSNASTPTLQPQTTHRVQKHGPAEAIISRSTAEGHATHLLPANTHLDDWWNSDATKSKLRNAKWFLLSVFLLGSAPHESVDEVLSASRTRCLFQDATLTYIVISVRSMRKVGVDKNDSNTDISGLGAIQTLLDSKYKVQLLSSSHFVESDSVPDWYRPNHTFKTRTDAERFLLSGADAAMTRGGEREHFEALLFATRGLDLAIPSRLSLLRIEDFQACQSDGAKATGRCSVGTRRPMDVDGNVLLSCREHHAAAKISFAGRGGLRFSLEDKMVDPRDDNVEVWMGHENESLAEAACMKGTTVSNPNQPSVSCATRILRKPPPAPMSQTEGVEEGRERSSRKNNLLLIFIDPISRRQFRRSLPDTAALLKKRSFVHFGKYTAVGNDFGLYTGVPRVGGRDGIEESLSHGTKKGLERLWDHLASAGCATFMAEDACVGNSNMVQSRKPQTTHGEQLTRMFCFDFDRPNCLGRHLSAKYLVEHAKQFMDTYGSADDPRPWAAFLSFVDSREDSSTLVSYIDALLVRFLSSLDLDATTVVVTSGDGLRHGHSFRAHAERERAKPILYLRAPRRGASNPMKLLHENAKHWTTPFDLHETILDLALGERTPGGIGTSLTDPLPDSRRDCRETPGIPARVCSLLSPSTADEGKTCTFMKEVPSVLSFYADIPRKNRPSWPKCAKRGRNAIVGDDKECKCAALCKNESDCNRNCWNASRYQTRLQDPLNMTVCPTRESPHYTLDLNININAKKEIETRHLRRKSLLASKLLKSDDGQSTMDTKPPDLAQMPNILFLEIDSLSQSAAVRHMPKTISVLKSHRIIKTLDHKLHCPTGHCAAMFGKTSVVGHNSIPNQAAALSGCIDRALPGVKSHLWPLLKTLPYPLEIWCPESDENSPWLFDVVKYLGYVTLFGDEFCYDNSPFIVQDNIFKLDVDYNLKDVFCRISKALEEFSGLKGDHDTSKRPDPCVAGRSRQEFALEYIRGVWDAYPNTPKFAYVNSIAGHDYSIDLAYQALGIEDYDDYLSDFLKEMLQRHDANNTIIVLRSDHGIQGGVAPVDFSFQVEQMHPFNNLIVPARFEGFSLDALFHNQNKLVTGFDLYRTLRSILRPRIKENNGSTLKKTSKRVNMSDWSFDLLRDAVPRDRTCRDANIKRQICPCIEEREDLMP